MCLAEHQINTSLFFNHLYLLRNDMNATQRLRLVLTLLCCSTLAGLVHAQPNILADSVQTPLGLAFDAEGNIWMAQHGTANDDSQISILTPDGQVHPFMRGLPSDTNATGEVTGSNHIYFDESGLLWIVQGESPDSLGASLLVADPSGFIPGDPPLGPEDLIAIHKIGDFSLANGAMESNPFTMVVGPDGDQFVVDAAANALIRRNPDTGELSQFAQFPSFSNPTPVGPPFIQSVPTGIVYHNERFYVSTLTGFPFVDGLAVVYEIDLGGNMSVFQEGLTTVVDLAVDPTDGQLVALHFGKFSFEGGPPGFVPGTGAVLKLYGTTVDTLATGLLLPSAMQYNANGELFISSLFGFIQQVEPVVDTAIDSVTETPGSFILHQNYPNPFNSTTTITYELREPTHVQLRVFDLQGRLLESLVHTSQTIGKHHVKWHAERVGSGLYLYTLQAGLAVQVRQMHLLK